MLRAGAAAGCSRYAEGVDSVKEAVIGGLGNKKKLADRLTFMCVSNWFARRGIAMKKKINKILGCVQKQHKSLLAKVLA